MTRKLVQLVGDDENNAILKVQKDGSIDVNVQDQTSRPVDLFFAKGIGTPTTLTVATGKDDKTVTVASVTDISIGDYLGIFSGISGEGKFYFGEVLGIAGLVLTLDTPLDTVFDIGDPVIGTTRDLNVDGSTTAQTYSVQAGGVTSTIDVDITRIMFKIITLNPPEFSMFGDIVGGLINGCVLRRNNGVTENIFNVKTNGEIANLMYDLTFYDQNKIQGVNGIVARMTFAGQNKHGVAIRLCPGDYLDFIIQDNLSSLLSFRLIAEGHEVTEGTS